MEENVKGKRCRDHSTPTASRLTYGVQRHGVVRALEGPVDQWARCAVHAREDLDLLDARRLLGPPPQHSPVIPCKTVLPTRLRPECEKNERETRITGTTDQRAYLNLRILCTIPCMTPCTKPAEPEESHQARGHRARTAFVFVRVQIDIDVTSTRSSIHLLSRQGFLDKVMGKENKVPS